MKSDFDPKFALFRAKDAESFEESGIMALGAIDPSAMEGAVKLAEEGYEAGHELKLLFAMPGMSLTHVWFKSGFPLPRHSHDADCLYYIIAGNLRIGTEELAAGDGFYIGSDVPYTYTPGADGVELLEFRASNAFDIKLLASNPAFWTRAAQTVQAKQGVWAEEKMPVR
jgi:hypothetical protein